MVTSAGLSGTLLHTKFTEGVIRALPHETPRLRLRHLREADLQHFQTYRSDAELGRYQGWVPMDDSAALAFLKDMAGSAFCPPGAWCQLCIAELGDDGLIGDIGIHLQADGSAAEIGFTLARHAQGRGLALEAVQAAIDLVFAHTAAARVVGITDARNSASVRLLERAGMRRFTTLDAVFRDEACVEHHHVRHRHGLAEPLLRAATAQDAEAVARVLIDARRELMPYAPSAHADDDVRQWVRETLIPAGGVTVALTDAAVAGVLALRSPKDAAWIDQLCVHPTQAARGIGRALLAHALATLPGTVELWTFQANVHARAFYERHGFVAARFTDGADNEERCPDVLYRLQRGEPAALPAAVPTALPSTP